jgi:low affinity Fe/Cu permease
MVGSPLSFLIALGVIVVWGVTGPVFGFSDTWQLVINTGTTIVTFLMVFLIQNTQNRDAKAFHLKLDELIRGTVGPRTDLVDLEDMTEDELDRLQEQFHRLRESYLNSADKVRDAIEQERAERDEQPSGD